MDKLGGGVGLDLKLPLIKIKMKCKHKNKVYEAKLLLSMPPKRRWICRDCGKEGIESMYMRDFNMIDKYEELKIKFTQ